MFLVYSNLSNICNIFNIEKHTLLFNIKKKNKKLVDTNINNLCTYYLSLGLLLSKNNLLKKNLRRSFSGLKLLLSSNFFKLNNLSVYLYINNFLKLKYLITYINQLVSLNVDIKSVSIYNYYTLNLKIKRNIKRRISKRVIQI